MLYFTVFRPRVFFSESAEEDSADSINKAHRRTDGYTTRDGVQIRHSEVGVGGCGYSGDRLPGARVANVQDRPSQEMIPTSAHGTNTKQTHDR